LVINPDAVLSAPVSFQSLETIPGRNLQIAEASGRMQVKEFSPCCPFDQAESGHGPTPKQGLYIGAPKRSYQSQPYDGSGIISRGIAAPSDASFFPPRSVMSIRGSSKASRGDPFAPLRALYGRLLFVRALASIRGLHLLIS
jgi:hypothetical protein